MLYTCRLEIINNFSPLIVLDKEPYLFICIEPCKLVDGAGYRWRSFRHLVLACGPKSLTVF